MKNKLKGLLLLLLILGVSFTMPGFMDNTTRAADEAEWSEEGGSTFHGFTIVEIVPYKGMGEIGYLIGGQEPVDGSLINWDNATGAFGFLGDAVKVYPNYTESALPVSGQAANGWRAAYTYVSQNGYFELQGSSGPNLYSINENQTVYERVAAGTGAYKASLPANYSLGNLYDTYNTVNNRKNVKAYFVYGQPTGVSLFSTSNRYRAYSVTRSNTNSGDYDYDVAGKVFVYNAAGKGMYDVLFVADGAGSYYMLNQYEIVEDNSGDYSCDTVTYTQLSGNTGGNYNRVTGVPTFTYQQYWGGYYRWVQDNGALTKPTNYYREGNRIWVKGFKVQQGYQYCYMGQIVNNEWFKTMTLGIPAEQVREYPVRVITITPEELNNTANQHYIDEANLFYINANYDHNVNYISNYENYSTAGRALPANQKYAGDSNKRYNDLNFAKHDISWTVTDKLFRKIAGIGCNKASLIIDAKFYMDAISNNHSAYKPYYKNNVNLGVNYNNNGATSLNMAKLYIMIYQRNMIDFYNSFINPATSIAQNRITAYEVSTNINPTGSTGSFIRPDSNNSATSNASIYWNGNTFLPFGLNADGVMTTYPNAQALYAAGIYNIDMTLQTTDITNNVLTLNGQDIFTSKFTQGVTVPNRNAGDVLTPEDITNQLGANNPSGTTDSTISIGDFANIITNNGSGYGNTGGVSYPGGSNVEGPPEVRPPEDPAEIPEDGTDGSNLRSYKRVLNIQPTAFFTNSENEIRAMLSNYDVQIISMTSMQFNGCVEDLNSRYDMIYLGSGVYNNISYNRFNTFSESGVTRTDFNDTSLNRFIYTVAGDLKSFTDSQTYRYVSNDITAQKKTELEAFRAAGYPIVVDSNLYELSTTNNARVNSNTNIYKFINTSKSSSNLFNYSNYTNGLTRSVFLTKLKYCFNTIRPIVKLETPILPDTSDVNYAYVDPVTRYLTIRFKLLPKNSIPSIYTYNAYLYLDKNGDGIFEASEKLDTRSRDGSQWTDMRENSSKTYMYEYDMSALNGVYQWKLIVERAGNTNIRATITGYAANSKPEDLYILQITDNSSAYSLDEMILNSTKLISRYAGAGKLTDYKLHFDTLTVSEYEQLFASPNVAYRSSNPTATGKLSKYHILIMDNPTDPIHNDNGAVQNIKDEINRNLGVIYTKGAIGYQKQSNYYEAAKNSFIYYDSVSNSYQYTYHYINRYSLDGSNPLFIYKGMKGDNGSTNLKEDSTYLTNYLTKANEGSITQYPYKINKAIKIANNSYSNDAVIDYDLTKSQRLIGWYCLSDTGSPVVREVFSLGLTSDLYNGMYSSSPNDVKNNYYLFSNRTCYYSGIKLSAADAAGNTEEMKLFVNTIIACRKTAVNRTVSTPPEIDITSPEPVVMPDHTQKITITSADITGTDFILSFQLLNSASNMSMKIMFNEVDEPTGTWDDLVYLSDVTGSLGPAIDCSAKVLQKDNTYALKIPAGILMGTNKLTLIATNVEGNSDTEVVYLEYVQPPVITIVKPELSTNATGSYLYVDLDYSGEDRLSSEEFLRVEFKVDHALTDVSLSFTSGTNSLMDGGADDVSVYKITDGVEASVPLTVGVLTPNSNYALYIPAIFIKNVNSRELMITAMDTNGLTGSTTVIILRRSLFPLD